MNKVNQISETYRACWSNSNSANRTNELQQIISEDFKYLDPNKEIIGYEKLSDYMFEFQKEFVGASFTISDFQVLHNSSLAHWNMVNAENEIVGNGTDYAIYENGKLKQITSFYKQG